MVIIKFGFIQFILDVMMYFMKENTPVSSIIKEICKQKQVETIGGLLVAKFLSEF